MDTEGNTHANVSVVDGQQRLTTIVLLLDGICRALACLSESAKVLSHGIKKNYIAATESNGQPLFKLSLNQDTDHFFKTTILSNHPAVEGPRIISEQRLNAAKKTITEYLSASADPDADTNEQWLQALYTKVVRQLRFTLYEVEDEAEVGIIFEVMNDRGKPLTELEKVKNYLLHVSTYLDIENELAISVNNAWGEIFRGLMAAGLVNSDDEDRLLRTHWLTHYDPRSRQWNGSKSIKDKFALKRYKGRHRELLTCLHGYVDGLRESSVSFCDAFAPNRTEAFGSYKEIPSVRTQIIEWSEKLSRIGVLATFLPLLLAARMNWPDAPKKYLTLLRLCETFAFRVYRLEGHYATSGQPALFRLGYQLAKRKSTFGDAKLTIKTELAYRCGNKKFKKALTANKPTSEPSEWYTWTGLRYFLYEYELSLAADQGASPKVTWNDLHMNNLQDTIEHILPQSINNQPYWQDRFTKKKIHRQYVHDLGNLTLTKHNSHLQNRSFTDKKGTVDSERHCYAKSPLYVERELVRWEHWGPSAIDNRRCRLLKWARRRWAVDLSVVEDDWAEPEAEDDEI